MPARLPGRGALPRGQVLQGGDEGKLHALALVVTRLRCRRGVGGNLAPAGVRLDPRQLG